MAPHPDSLSRSLVQVTEHSFNLLLRRLELFEFDARAQATRLAARAVWAAVAVIFGMGAVICLSAALYLTLAIYLPPSGAMAILAGVHLLILAVAAWRLQQPAPKPWPLKPSAPEKS